MPQVLEHSKVIDVDMGKILNFSDFTNKNQNKLTENLENSRKSYSYFLANKSKELSSTLAKRENGRFYYIDKATGSKVFYDKTLSNLKSNGVKKPHAADPIFSPEVRKQIKSYLLTTGKYSYRNHLIYVMGCNIGRRIGDILKLRIGQVFDGTNIIRDIEIYEEKTLKKSPVLTLNDDIVDALELYLASLSDFDLNDFLFPSRRSDGSNGGHLTVKSYWRILDETSKALNLSGELHLSTHSLRKTCFTLMYDNDPDNLSLIQYAAGHSTQSHTLRYLGLTGQRMKSAFMDIRAFE